LRRLRHDADELYANVESLNHRVVANDEALQTASASLREALQTVTASLRASEDKFGELSGEVARLRDRIEHLRVRNAELEHMISAPRRSSPEKAAGTHRQAGPELFAANHDLDAFYLEFENRFRGTEQEVKDKQTPYLKLFESASVDRERPVVDLGCGRGEFLALLTENGFKTIGVDLNEAMVRRARERGLEAVESDAIGYLAEQSSGSLAGVTGFHLAEHIPFDQVLLLMTEAYRCLAKGGILLLETPNPESVFVGAFTFHYDPSHLKPLPPAIMQFAALFKGFERAEIMRVQPELTEAQIVEATRNATLQDALRRLYGPRDYALVAYK
jgi:O-antigen chain-terminating methyltransferase